MSDQPAPAPTPVVNRSRVVLTIYLVVFVMAAVGMTIFGFKVVADVKARAGESDAALRLVAWQILAYADREGVFPTADSSSLIEAGGTDTLQGALAVDADDAWPRSRATAAGSVGMASDEAEAAKIVQVSWPPSADLPPVLGVGGRPSGLVPGGTTLELVNGWLRAARDQLERN